MPDSDLDYAYTTGRLGLAVGDGPDAGDNPDLIWCNEGEVKFIPEQTFTKVTGAGGGPATLGQAVIVATIDNDGYITYNGKRGVWLVDLTSEKVNPVITEGATHRVEFSGVKANGVAVAFPPARLRLTRDGDGVSPDNANDITRLMPVNPGASTPIVVGPAGVSVERLEVTAAGKLAYTLSDGTEEIAGDLPVGPGGSAEGIAGYLSESEPVKEALDLAAADLLDDPASAFRAKQTATVAAGVQSEVPPLVAAALAEDGTVAEAAVRALTTTGVVTGAADAPRPAPLADRAWGLATDDGHALPLGFREDGKLDAWSRERTLADLHDVTETRDPQWARVLITDDGHMLAGVRWDGRVFIPGLESPPASASGLGAFHAAAATAADLPVPVVFAGSSTTAASGATSRATSFPTRLLARIRARWSPATTTALQWSQDANFTPETGPGVHGYSAGQGGTGATTYLTDTECDRIAALGPRLVIHMVGSNDQVGSKHPPQFATEVRARLAYLDSVIEGPCTHLLAHSFLRLDSAGTVPWSAYADALRDIAAEAPNRAFVDCSGPFVLAGVDGPGSPDPLGLIHADQAHPSDRGHALLADHIAADLGC